jgi:hypothetical protein
MRRMALLITLLAACGGDDDGGGGSDAGGGNPECETEPGSTPASGVVRIGGVTSADGSSASIEGFLVAGMDWEFFNLAPQRQEESMRAGDCVLYLSEPSFCDPECVGTMCHQGECLPFPEPLSAGTLRVVAGGELIAVDPDTPTFWGRIYRQQLLAAPPAGDSITLCAGGDDAAGFGAILRGVPPLMGAVPDDNVVELEDGGDLVVTWDGESDARVRLTLNADNMNHGQPFPGVIQCDVEDTGQLVVPQALVEAFPPVPRPPAENFACGGTDCPRSSLIRYRSVNVSEPDLELEIRAESAVEFWISHE